MDDSVSSFACRVAAVRRRLDCCMRTGIIPQELKNEIQELRDQEQTLLNQALPHYRKMHLNDPDCDIHADIMKVAESLDPGRLQEDDLTERERKLCGKLKSESAGEKEPDIPDTQKPGLFDPDRYEETFWLCARNEETAFLFGDGGSVLLFEKNCGTWQCREKPILTDCLVQNAVMESSSSCLAVNLDGGVDRIRYQRMENEKQLEDSHLL